MGVVIPILTYCVTHGVTLTGVCCYMVNPCVVLCVSTSYVCVYLCVSICYQSLRGECSIPPKGSALANGSSPGPVITLSTQPVQQPGYV